ncbi:hypothetical protein [Pedobacter duraquae]|uniref:Lipoprotein n=1 Tax=Pedobacter duraquae TaxID=425511 RepID=A0A4R6ICL1_9SPHI|nr:hypothetical protein [Pedobacter duraquae]TDO19317.1 hypothetical protein CLV32_4557 [Pedobacter duraquae]
MRAITSSGYYLKSANLLAHFSLLISLLVTGCGPAPEHPVASNNTKKAKPDTISAPVVSQVVPDTTNQTECPRGASEPVVKKSVFPDAHFVLQADRMTGLETFSMPQGDKVKITQSGCEYYTLKFEIETTRFAADTTDLSYWRSAAITLMRQVNKGLQTPLEIVKGLDAVSARIKSGESNPADMLSLGEEVDYGGSDPREYLTIDRISRLADKRYLLQITFSYGPM